MKITRIWAMPNCHTFDIQPVRELIMRVKTAKGGVWIDPYANSSRIADVTNDLNPDHDTDCHMDGLAFLKTFGAESVDGVLFDPPYSPRQVSECYASVGRRATYKDTSAQWWALQKQEIARILKPGGLVVACGWNSGGIGRKYGFKMLEILLVPHGGMHNDTIVTVEAKRGAPLSLLAFLPTAKETNKNGNQITGRPHGA